MVIWDGPAKPDPPKRVLSIWFIERQDMDCAEVGRTPVKESLLYPRLYKLVTDGEELWANVSHGDMSLEEGTQERCFSVCKFDLHSSSIPLPGLLVKLGNICLSPVVPCPVLLL